MAFRFNSAGAAAPPLQPLRVFHFPHKRVARPPATPPRGGRAKFPLRLAAAAGALLVVCAVSSCSDSEPAPSSVDAAVIFDYSSDDSPPSARLSVFVEVGKDDAPRASKVRVTSKEKNYVWTARDPVVIGSSSRGWAGSADFFPPFGESIPRGAYEVEYIDAADRSAVSSFEVNYNNDLPSSTSGEAKALLGDNAESLVAIYGEGVLLYFGAPREDWLDESARVWLDVNGSDETRECIVDRTKTIMCLMPVVKKNPPEDAQENSADGGEPQSEETDGGSE